MKDIIKVDDENFEAVTASGIVLVDFFADWCGPCRMLTPILEQLATEMSGQVVIAKLNVDDATKTTEKYQITSIPTLLLFKNGEKVNQVIGLKDLEGLKKIIAQVL